MAILLYGDDPSHRIFLKQTEDGGRALGVRIQPMIVNGVDQLEAAFSAIRKERAQALIVQPIFVNTLASGPQIADLALKYRMPTISDGDNFAEAGGLVFYGADPLSVYKRLAHYADRVLRGAKPAGLPIEQPSKFELVINLKTAMALGVKLPQSLIQRADRVIE